MSRVDIFGADIFHHVKFGVVRNGTKEFQSFHDIRGKVERFDRRLVVPEELLVHELGVFFLDVAAIQQHDLAEIAGRRGAVNQSMEAFSDKLGNISAVVDMSVR